jgi:hypothetical protein
VPTEWKVHETRFLMSVSVSAVFILVLLELLLEFFIQYEITNGSILNLCCIVFGKNQIEIVIPSGNK